MGPLTEVIAQSHTWNEVEKYITDPPMRGFVAYERAIRGDTVENDASLQAILEILTAVPFNKVKCNTAAQQDDDPDIEQAVRGVVEAWTSQSNGRVSLAAVSGGIASALGALGLNEAYVSPLEPTQVMSLVAWAGASGGAHGRRRGMAQGRFSAWWLATAFADALDEWPLRPNTLLAEMEELQWFTWREEDPLHGWQLQLAVEDPFNDMSWAFSARDISS